VSITNKLDINENTILTIRNPIDYERKGVLKNGEKELEVNLRLPSGTFNGANSVIEI
jgi:hypothetical protein